MQYTQDYDERMPRVATKNKDKNDVAWQEQIQPYVKSTQIFACPSNQATAKLTNVSSAYTGAIRANYVGNGSWGATASALGLTFGRPMDNTDSGGTAVGGRSLAEIKVTSQCIVVNEQDNTAYTSPYLYRTDSGTGGAQFTSHLQTTNFLFADGHVKAMRPAQTYSGSIATNDLVNMWALNYDSTPQTSLPGNLATRQANMD